jgi:hypothetical protein
VIAREVVRSALHEACRLCYPLRIDHVGSVTVSVIQMLVIQMRVVVHGQ